MSNNLVTFASEKSYLKSNSQQNAANGIVGKSSPQNWVIPQKSLV